MPQVLIDDLRVLPGLGEDLRTFDDRDKMLGQTFSVDRGARSVFSLGLFQVRLKDLHPLIKTPGAHFADLRMRIGNFLG